MNHSFRSPVRSRAIDGLAVVEKRLLWQLSQFATQEIDPVKYRWKRKTPLRRAPTEAALLSPLRRANLRRRLHPKTGQGTENADGTQPEAEKRTQIINRAEHLEFGLGCDRN
jgi:hypothetical protein